MDSRRHLALYVVLTSAGTRLTQTWNTFGHTTDACANHIISNRTEHVYCATLGNNIYYLKHTISNIYLQIKQIMKCINCVHDRGEGGNDDGEPCHQ